MQITVNADTYRIYLSLCDSNRTVYISSIFHIVIVHCILI